jgi:probable addiction module antidote protein
MKSQTTPFDPADYLGADEDQIDLLRDAFASGNTAYIVNAIGVVARARNISELARETGLTRAGLYKAFGAEGDPKLSTVIGVLEALGFKLSVALESRPAA